MPCRAVQCRAVPRFGHARGLARLRLLCKVVSTIQATQTAGGHARRLARQAQTAAILLNRVACIAQLTKIDRPTVTYLAMHSIRAGKLSKLSKAAEQQVSPHVHTSKLCCAAVCWYVRYGGKGILEYSSKA